MLALILIFFGQMARGSVELSATSDEPPHIANGYITLTTGDSWALSRHRHPPLLNAWSAWPLLLQPERPDATTLAGWGEDFVVFVRAFWPLLGPVERWTFATRLPNMLLGVLLLVLVQRWARQAFGRAGALVAIAAMVFDPTMVAHAQLNTTDIGVTLFVFAALYVAGQRRSTRATWLGTGALVGAACASKGSGIVLVPIATIVVGLQMLRSSDRSRTGWVKVLLRRWIISGVTITAVAFIVLWATYGFRLEPTAWHGLRLPLVAHTQMVRMILSESRRVAFLMGELRWGGWWWYFPLAFAIKTPLPLIVMLAAAVVALMLRPRRLLDHVALWLYPIFYLGTSIASGMNIGYRHLLSIFPFGYVVIAHLVQIILAPTPRPGSPRGTTVTARLSYALLVALLGWQATEALTVAPFGLAYFNELAGGPQNGYRYLVDSNDDWGQSFIALASYMDDHAIGKVWLSYYTWVDPAVYGVRYAPLPPVQGANLHFPHPYDPAPGVYAISATPLQGVMMADQDLYDWFRHRDPVAQPGYGLLVYNVPDRTAVPQWVAQCTQPLAPLTPEAIIEGFGRDDLRQITFDCIHGWILPAAGAESGWYVLHGAAAEVQDAFVERQLSGTQLSYRQREPRTLPPFAIYEQTASVRGPDAPLSSPIEFGTLTLLGYTAPETTGHAGDTLDIDTWWRVEQIPNRPLSLMLHLGVPGQPPIDVGDGLAVPIEQWAVGDILVQRHRLNIPAEADPGTYSAVTGAYWLDTVKRLTVTAGDPAGLDSVPLVEMEVR